MAYSSQFEDELGRMWRKQGKIEARLGKNWRRLKGMKRRTYERLWGELMDCEERRDEAFEVLAGRLFGLAQF